MATIGIVKGTNRQDGNTAKVVRHLDAIYRALGQPTELVDLSKLPPEIFSPSSYAEKPTEFKPFADAVLQCDGLHVVTPEYNGGIPGILKYFIDMLRFPESLEKKPTCFTGLSTGYGGGLRSVEQLQAIFLYRKAYLFPDCVLIPLIGNHLTKEGRIGDNKVLDELREQAEGFVGFVKLLTGGD